MPGKEAHGRARRAAAEHEARSRVAELGRVVRTAAEINGIETIPGHSQSLDGSSLRGFDPLDR